MRSRRQLAVAFATLAAMATGSVLLAACDTGDGRQMQAGTTTTAAPTTSPLFVADGPNGIVSTSTPANDRVAVLPGAPIETLPGEAVDPTALRIVAPWADGAAVDVVYTCDGIGAAPTFELTAPGYPRELAVALVDDGGHVYLVVTGIPTATTRFDMVQLPATAVVQVNSLGQHTYDPPCPPPGETRTITATVYALDKPVTVTETDSVIEIFAALDAVALSTASVAGTYTRPST